MGNNIKRAPVIDFTKYKRKEVGSSDKILSIDVFKEEGDVNFSYVMLKHGKKRKADDFLAYCLLRVVTDILEYNEDPANILDLAEEMMGKLGYDIEEGDEDEQ